MTEAHESQFDLDVSTVVEQIEQRNGLIIDVREVEEVSQFSVPGSQHIPLGSLAARTDEIPRDADVYLLCHVGQRSAMATEYLRGLGYQNVWNIRGGIIAWLRAGHPVSSSQVSGQADAV